MLEEGDPVDVILDVAEALSMDLIILGSRKRGMISRAWHGSVAKEVLKSANCAVQIIRETKVPRTRVKQTPFVFKAEEARERDPAVLSNSK